MRHPVSLLLIPALLATAACGNKQVALSADPVERAATCGVVAAAQARVNMTDIKAPLPVEAQGEVLRYALVAGAEGEQFAADRASAVVQRMPAIADEVTDGNWKKLVEPCAQAYPAAAAQPELPRDPLTAGMGCDALRQFVGRALASDGRYEETLTQYSKLESALDKKIAPVMAQRGIAASETDAEKSKAFSAIAKLGNPAMTMDACVQRYT